MKAQIKFGKGRQIFIPAMPFGDKPLPPQRVYFDDLKTFEVRSADDKWATLQHPDYPISAVIALEDLEMVAE